MRRAVKILVWIGPNAGSLVSHVARLARERGAAITLVDVIDETEMIIRPVGGRGWDVPTLARREALARLERAAHRARSLGLGVHTRLRVGHPVQTLVDEVARRDYDLLATGAPLGRRRRTRYTAARLARESPRPVLVVPARSSGGSPGRVLVAIDTGRWRGVNLGALNKTLIETGRWFAGTRGQVHVLHVWDTFGVDFLKRGAIPKAEIRRYVTETQVEREHEFAKAMGPFKRVVRSAHLHLERGDPRDVIPTFARRHRMDLVVVGTAARKGLPRWIVGNTAEALLGALPCSLLVVPARV